MIWLCPRRPEIAVALLLFLTASAWGQERIAYAAVHNAGGPGLPEAPQPQPASPEFNSLLPAWHPAPGYVPLTAADKLGIFLRQTYSPYTFLGVAFDAGFAHATNDWPGYGMGMQGYGKRYGALLADREAQTFFSSFLFATALHQDPRYFRMGPGHSLLHRTAYAVSRVVVTRSDFGGSTPNSSLWMGTLLARSLTNAYYPAEDRGFSDTMGRFSGSLLSTAQTNLTREFLPDLMKIFHRHEPDRMKEWEERMPAPLTHAVFGTAPTAAVPATGR
jgi:hypothetical protein